MKIEGEIGPSPDICFAEGWYPINKSKNDFMMLSCYKEETLIGWITLIKEYPKNDIVYISHFSIVDVDNKQQSLKLMTLAVNSNIFSYRHDIV